MHIIKLIGFIFSLIAISLCRADAGPASFSPTIQDIREDKVCFNHKGSKICLEGIDEVQSITFSPDSSVFATTSRCGLVHLRCARTGKLIQELKEADCYLRSHWDDSYDLMYNYCRAVAVSPDGAFIAAGSDDGKIRLWDFLNGTYIKAFEDPYKKWILSLAFNPKMGHIASGSTKGMTESGDICIWDIHSSQLIQALRIHSRNVNSLAFSYEGTMLASGSGDHTVRVWDTRTWLCLYILNHLKGVHAVAFNPKSFIIASGGEEGYIRLWDATTGLCIKALPQTDQECVWTRSLAFSPDGNILAAGGGISVGLFDVATAKCLHKLMRQRVVSKYSFGTPEIMAVAISRDGKTIASAAGDTVQLAHFKEKI